MINSWSVKVAGYIGKELDLDDKTMAIVSYGIEVIIGALIKFTVFIIVPWMLGVLVEFMVAYFSFAILRIVAGGVHCSKFYRCLIVSVTSYLAIAFIAIYISSYALPYTYQEIYWGILVFSFLVVITKAPVDVQEKPIINPKRRLCLKIASCLVVGLYMLISVYWHFEDKIYVASGLGILFQVFSVTKSGAKFFKLVDQII
ncbi:accessory gene regulator ArgB-like protein [Desulfoscipio gibsoniae]|uniref:Protein possibly involved in post-translational modification of quorum-sensing peptides n=1 Tax=Desulfoscipio gibsoniae DSM 7213 TaxID=767817 RepID=R4KJV9_9FIRM|nr:accessory gene regulator B family protein [Desulfoscipio gibsoniae]AGL01892.1 protein possibly involved in post-translational modification of quorum-sensing peptides [Desulfoscipio gibsoniae DSM 7213]